MRPSVYLPLLTSLTLLTLGSACSSGSNAPAGAPPAPITVQASSGVWRFGVMGDTQWPGSTADNPNSVSVGIIKQVDQEFIKQGVKFVIQVGDLQDDGTDTNLATRAQAAQDLVAAGIGFYPLRGNHEGEDAGFTKDAASAREFKSVFPQTQGSAMGSLAPSALSLANFSSPGKVALGDTGLTDGLSDLTGLSYSFDYLNVGQDGTNISPARFILLDQFTPPDATMDGLGKIAPQQTWINSQLAGKPKFVLNGQLNSGHAFVFGHKGLITENHADTLFGNNINLDSSSNCAQNSADTDNFINSLYNNGVRYYMGGHDHIHNRALVANTKKANAITNLIAASCSYKFYTPKQKPNDKKYNVPVYGFTRETEISQDLYRVGYYIFTVDGPNVTVDYYGSEAQGAVDPAHPGANIAIATTPTLTFSKRETFGYSLVGKEFLIAQGKDYTSIADSYNANPTSPSSFTTTAKLLATNPVNGGIYNASYNPANPTTWLGDYSGYADPSTLPATLASAPRAFSRAVDTGWSRRTTGLACDIFKLWGMNDMGKSTTDTYVLSLTYDPKTVLDAQQVANGWFCLVSNGGGNWVNAVNLNTGGKKNFIQGAYDPKYGLGSYGVDTSKNTVWAVINYAGDFSAAMVQ